MMLRLLRDRKTATSFFEAKRISESEGLQLLTNAEMSANGARIAEMAHTQDFMLLCSLTIVAHPRSMGVFSDTVSYADPVSGKKNVLEIPKEFRGLGDVALVSNDYEIIPSSDRFTYEPRSRLSLINAFPRENGYNCLEQEHSIPVTVQTTAGEGRLSRFRQEMVGPVIRCISRHASDRRSNYTLPAPPPSEYVLAPDVLLNICPSGAFVVVAGK